MTRIDYYAQLPDLITELRHITQQLEHFTVEAKLRLLIETRVSQINGCVYCVDLHIKQARKLGEIQQRLDTLAVWQESPFFDEREKAALAWAESLTLISQTHARDSEFQALKAYFNAREIVEISVAVSLANFWNRMAGGFRRIPAREHRSDSNHRH